MGLRERLAALDDRFLPPGHRERVRPTARFIVAVMAVSVAATILAIQLTRSDPLQPLGFNCVAPEQPVVERILATTVDGGRGVGGVGSQQASGSWTSSGTTVVEVTCTKLSTRQLVSTAIGPGDEGVIPGEPLAVLSESSQDGFASEIRFLHDEAEIRIALAEPVGPSESRALVESWLRLVALFDS